MAHKWGGGRFLSNPLHSAFSIRLHRRQGWQSVLHNLGFKVFFGNEQPFQQKICFPTDFVFVGSGGGHFVYSM